MHYTQEFSKTLLKLILIAASFGIWNTTNAQNNAQDLYYDIFPVTIHFKDIGSQSFEALFINEKNIQLPVLDIFKFIKFLQRSRQFLFDIIPHGMLGSDFVDPLRFFIR